MFQTRDAAKNYQKNPDGLANLCWAINSFEDIHGIEYAKAVYERLSAAAASGLRSDVIKALAGIANDLERNRRFW